MSDIEKVKKLREATGAGFKDCNSAIKESIKLGIPIIAVLDTNSNPDGIDFPIPGNDDARRSIDLYCSLIKDTINDAKNNIKVIPDESQNEKNSLNKSDINSKKNEKKTN